MVVEMLGLAALRNDRALILNQFQQLVPEYQTQDAAVQQTDLAQDELLTMPPLELRSSLSKAN